MDLAEKSKMRLLAPAKVNLRLKITGRRPDGYHLLDMVMVKLDLSDEIDLELGGSGIRMECDRDLPLDSSNTVWKAVDAVRKESGQRFGVTVRIHKRIPIAAGLGGGSSDAAGVLKGLNDLLALGWDTKKLIEVGMRIGADVPFFLVEGSQRVRGIGEVLEPITIPPVPLILINPGFPVSTTDAYQWYDLTREKDNDSKASVIAKPDETRGRQIAGFEMTNDLEEVVIPRYPVLAAVKERLQAGALGTLMSGSGPTVFGLFNSAPSRDRGYEILLKTKDPEWWICKTASL